MRHSQLWWACVAISVLSAVNDGAAQCISPYMLSDFGGARIAGLAVASDGTVWLTQNRLPANSSESAASRVVRIDPYGDESVFNLPVNVAVGSIAVAPDGSAYFAEVFAENPPSAATTSFRIGRIAAFGGQSEFALPANGPALALLPAANSVIWFAQQRGGLIGRMTTTGQVTILNSTGTGENPGSMSITAGGDGSIWFSSSSDDRIGRITPEGTVTYYELPKSPRPAGVVQLVVASNGDVWFSEAVRKALGRLTTDGAITEYAGLIGSPRSVAVGADGRVWASEPDMGRIASITTSGVIVEYDTTSALPNPELIAAVTNGEIWATGSGPSLGRIIRCSRRRTAVH
jgi:virginiamycin B lyase